MDAPDGNLMQPSLYELLHCLIITYNRAESLRTTLSRLAVMPGL